MCATAPALCCCVCNCVTVQCTDMSLCVVVVQDSLLWGRSQEEACLEDDDPEGHFVRHNDPQRYSKLYVYLLLETIGAWVHVKALLLSVINLLKGPVTLKEVCLQLLQALYQVTYNLAQKMSVMLSLNADLWEDGDYHEMQRKSNPHWHSKKEVFLLSSEVLA